MFGFGKASKQNSPIFKFGDGKRITADEFGYLGVRWSGELSAKFIGEEFGAGKPCSDYEFSRDIEVGPFFAHLTLMAFNVGGYLNYVKNTLGADEEVCRQFMNGVSRSFSEIRDSNRRALHPELLQTMVSNVANFCDAIFLDFKAANVADPKVFNPLHTKATQMVLSGLRGWYAAPDQRASSDVISVQTMSIGAKLDDAPVVLYTILQKHLGVSIVKA
ncbi:hypothetical protein [Rhodoferax sediminis]|jgi:hypothetical protein|uniref:Uncharacterized protein n=1 Tax=Rhodoferax sediminis TaxID=2509614 RepID=A0A515DCM8_9BURK|nr:hypothetical protein [Rhodoferax sediminis]QDL38183.1 hypothetical protein EUB48_13465 [Rhodoferax sediminis]